MACGLVAYKGRPQRSVGVSFPCWYHFIARNITRRHTPGRSRHPNTEGGSFLLALLAVPLPFPKL